MFTVHINQPIDNISFNEINDTDFQNNYVNIPRQTNEELEIESYYNSFLEIPNVKLKAPIQKINLANEEKISPPDVKSVYLLSEYGNPFIKKAGLSVFITHSVLGGAGAGNFLYDDNLQKEKVNIGDKILLTSKTSNTKKEYKIIDTKIYKRDDLQKNSQVWSQWRNWKNQLVLITCWNRPNTNWSQSDNYIIYAKKV
jgi:sortase (surface protein transpeptidase)